WLAHFNIAKTRIGRGGSNPDRDQRALFLRRFDRTANNLLKCRGLFDDMIGWQNDHRRSVVARGDPGYPQRDGGGGVAFFWFGNDIAGRKMPEQFTHALFLAVAS